MSRVAWRLMEPARVEGKRQATWEGLVDVQGDRCPKVGSECLLTALERQKGHGRESECLMTMLERGKGHGQESRQWFVHAHEGGRRREGRWTGTRVRKRWKTQ